MPADASFPQSGFVYHVKNWSVEFENERSSQIKHSRWLPLQNRHDDDTYAALLNCPDGAAHWGAYVAILMIASRAIPRGFLLKENGLPHDAASISRVTRMDVDLVNSVLSVLQNECGLIESISTDEIALLQRDYSRTPSKTFRSRRKR